MLLVKLFESYSDVFQSFTLVVLVLRPSGRVSGVNQYQILYGTRQPIWNYKAIHSWGLTLLVLGVHGKDIADCQN